jgi:hypothetical protein
MSFSYNEIIEEYKNLSFLYPKQVTQLKKRHENDGTLPRVKFVTHSAVYDWCKCDDPEDDLTLYMTLGQHRELFTFHERKFTKCAWFSKNFTSISKITEETLQSFLLPKQIAKLEYLIEDRTWCTMPGNIFSTQKRMEEWCTDPDDTTLEMTTDQHTKLSELVHRRREELNRLSVFYEVELLDNETNSHRVKQYAACAIFVWMLAMVMYAVS